MTGCVGANRVHSTNTSTLYATVRHGGMQVRAAVPHAPRRCAYIACDCVSACCADGFAADLLVVRAPQRSIPWSHTSHSTCEATRVLVARAARRFCRVRVMTGAACMHIYMHACTGMHAHACTPMHDEHAHALVRTQPMGTRAHTSSD
jgi:hypothetical protein